jgi:hypothetical protein
MEALNEMGQKLSEHLEAASVSSVLWHQWFERE